MNCLICINPKCRGQHIFSSPAGHQVQFPWLIMHDCQIRCCRRRWYTCDISCVAPHNLNTQKYSSHYTTFRQVRRHHNVCHQFLPVAQLLAVSDEGPDDRLVIKTWLECDLDNTNSSLMETFSDDGTYSCNDFFLTHLTTTVLTIFSMIFLPFSTAMKLLNLRNWIFIMLLH